MQRRRSPDSPLSTSPAGPCDTLQQKRYPLRCEFAGDIPKPYSHLREKARIVPLPSSAHIAIFASIIYNWVSITYIMEHIEHMDFYVVAIIVLALGFDFVNGFHDTANSIATSVMTNAIKIPYAIAMAAILEFAGAMLGTHVAHTIGKSIVDPDSITSLVLIAALMSAIGWNIITWRYGLPSSSSHALIGSLVGVTLVTRARLEISGLLKVFLSLIISPILGIVGGMGLMILFYWIFRNIQVEKLNSSFRRVQLFSAAFMAFSHGGNDAQKSMGIITMALFAHHVYSGDFFVPLWVKIACATAMALGAAVGGWRIIKTVGRGIIELRPIQGCAAETVSATIIQVATQIGLPVSTTHVITSAICGVGATANISSVNWTVMRNIVVCWLVTIPIVAVFAGLIYRLLSLLLGIH
jgi:inorganic phosphate transporter, PiT family